MTILKEYKQTLENLLEEINSYENRQTKACSARIRKLSNTLGKDGIHLRKAMVEADKAN